MRFQFVLDRVDEIEPWGDGDDRKLHWFGLTSGRYWISTPLGEALRYTEKQMRHWGATSPYVDYQIARLFEDLQSILPAILEPVPSDVAAMVADRDWFARANQRMSSLQDEDEQRDRLYEAAAWYQKRSLDTMYLVSGPTFRFWRTGDVITVRWELGKTDAQQLWTLPEGQFSIDAEQFRKAAYKFLDEVLAEMQGRVNAIERTGWHRADCKLDIPLLLKEQRDRTALVEKMKTRSIETDWAAVRALMKSLAEKS